MTSTPFTLTLAIAGDPAPAALLETLAAHVLAHAGGGPAAAAGLAAALAKAAGDGAFAAGVSDLTCTSDGTSLDIQVSAGGAPVWQASCATS